MGTSSTTASSNETTTKDTHPSSTRQTLMGITNFKTQVPNFRASSASGALRSKAIPTRSTARKAAASDRVKIHSIQTRRPTTHRTSSSQNRRDRAIQSSSGGTSFTPTKTRCSCRHSSNSTRAEATRPGMDTPTTAGRPPKIKPTSSSCRTTFQLPKDTTQALSGNMNPFSIRSSNLTPREIFSTAPTILISLTLNSLKTSLRISTRTKMMKSVGVVSTRRT